MNMYDSEFLLELAVVLSSNQKMVWKKKEESRYQTSYKNREYLLGLENFGTVWRLYISLPRGLEIVSSWSIWSINYHILKDGNILDMAEAAILFYGERGTFS